MSGSEETRKRRSERVIKRKKTYSPEPRDGKSGDEKVKKKKAGAQKKPFGRTQPNRPYDVLPSGEPFSCGLCKSGFVGVPVKKLKKGEKSRHVPLPKIRTDASGADMLLCNPCGQMLETSAVRPKIHKPVQVPTEEEQQKYMEEATQFVNTLKRDHDDPFVERLYCPVSRKKLCGCVQKYFKSRECENETESTVKDLLSLMKEAESLRKQKVYDHSENVKVKRSIGLGNGHKKSKAFEEFVLCNRRMLKDTMQLCERAVQRILMYSNNFLHKKLKTENRPCRVERTRGKAVLGQLRELETLVEVSCCKDNCVMMSLTHRKLLQSWRDRAQQGQMEARRVLAEMLTPVGASHQNCNQFISMITGCSLSTIKRVFDQMVHTHGDRNPPEHGMKKVWQENYRLNKRISKPVPEVTSDCDNESESSTRTDTDSNVVFELQRQQLLKMQQEIEQKQQQLQQQQANLQLQILAQQVSATREQSQQTIEFHHIVPQPAQLSPQCPGIEVLQMQLTHPQQPFITCHSGAVVHQSGQLQPIMIQNQYNHNQSTSGAGNQSQLSLPVHLLPVAINQQTQSEGSSQVGNVQEIILSPFDMVQSNQQSSQSQVVVQQIVPESGSSIIPEHCLQVHLVPTQDGNSVPEHTIMQKQGLSNGVVLQTVGNNLTSVPLSVEQAGHQGIQMVSRNSISDSSKVTVPAPIQINLSDGSSSGSRGVIYIPNVQIQNGAGSEVSPDQMHVQTVSVDDQGKLQLTVQENECVQTSGEVLKDRASQIRKGSSELSPVYAQTQVDVHNGQSVNVKSDQQLGACMTKSKRKRTASGISSSSGTLVAKTAHVCRTAQRSSVKQHADHVPSVSNGTGSHGRGEIEVQSVEETGPSQLHMSVINGANIGGHLSNQLMLSNGKAFTIPVCSDNAKSNSDISTQDHTSSKVLGQSIEKSDKVQQLNGCPGKFQQAADKSSSGTLQRAVDSSIKSRQASGNSVKSRHSSGNGAVRSRQSSGNSISGECVRQFNWIFKQNDRSRQPSGNSQVADRSRRSSGNSLFDQSVLSNMSPSFFLLHQDGDVDTSDNFVGNLISDHNSFGNLIFNLTPVPDLQSPIESHPYVETDEDLATESAMNSHTNAVTMDFEHKMVVDAKNKKNEHSMPNEIFSKNNKSKLEPTFAITASISDDESEDEKVANELPVFLGETQCLSKPQNMQTLKRMLSEPSKFSARQENVGSGQ